MRAARPGPSPQHSFGAKFQSKSDFHLDGTINVDPPGLAYAAEVTWSFPESFVLAYSFRPNPTWNFEVDYQWVNWDRMENLVFTSPSAASMTQMFDWEASSTGGFGVTHELGRGWELSAGYEIVANSVPTRTFTPAGADMTHHFLSVGPRLTLGHWNISLVLQTDPSESRVVAGSTPSMAGQTADGTYTSHYWSTGLAIVRRL